MTLAPWRNYNVGMKIDIIAIGNSRGVRIPSSVLKQCGLTDQVELTVENGRIILERPAPREGWAESFRRMAEDDEPGLLLPEHPLTEFDSDEWSGELALSFRGLPGRVGPY